MITMPSTKAQIQRKNPKAGKAEGQHRKRENHARST